MTREAKKLKQLKKASHSKLQINTIDITLLSIESELIQYRKTKEKVLIRLSQKFTDNMTVVELYNSFSKRFMNMIEKIGEAT